MQKTPEQRAEESFRAEAAVRHAAFRAEPGWKKRTYRDAVVLERMNRENSRIVVSLADQRGLLLLGNSVALDFPVATGKRSHPTPKGNFTILEKIASHSSNLYGKILDAQGNVIASMADRRKAEIPEGGSFVGSPMPYWLRITPDGVGLHVGQLPGRPASHGCIRMPHAIAPTVYENVKVGTPVEIVEQYAPAAAG